MEIPRVSFLGRGVRVLLISLLLGVVLPLPTPTHAACAPYAVYGLIGAKWNALGSENGPLGCPVTDELPAAGGGRHNDFQYGFIYWDGQSSAAYAVYGAIGEKWNALGREVGFGYPLTDETSTPDGIGRYNHFQNGGSIYSSPQTGTHEVHGAIREKWASLGWEQSPLGYPVTDELPAASGGRHNDFQYGFIYWDGQSSAAYAVYGAIGEKWNALGREVGFGYPLTDETSTPDGIGRYNHFQNGGSIYSSPQTGAHEVHGAIREKWASLGWEQSYLGYPVSDEVATAVSSVRVSHFQGGSLCYAPWRGVYPMPGVSTDCNVVTVQNDQLALIFDLNAGMTLVSIYDKVNQHEYLSTPTFFFEFAVNDGTPYQSNQGFTLNAWSLSPDGQRLTVEGQATSVPVQYSLIIGMEANQPATIFQISVKNTSPLVTERLRTVTPKLRGLVAPGDPAQTMGMIPQEIGSAMPLRSDTRLGMPYGERPGQYAPSMGLPTAMNTMEVATEYNRDGLGGLFFADLSGDLARDSAPIQFTLSAQELAGFWRADLDPGAVASMPQFALGVYHTGDWHQAVDYYVAKHTADWHFPAIPAWLREQGAIYSPSCGGAGGIYLAINPCLPLREHIHHNFSELPQLLKEAQSLGTNVVYLWDYWQGPTDKDADPYFFKGDYIPDPDLSGIQTLTDAIRSVHQLGGHVILYIEPFIISENSQVAQDHRDWRAVDDFQVIDNAYRCTDQDRNAHLAKCYYKMVAPYQPWQDYVVNVAKRLVGYGADGVFLDSWGWQMNWPVRTLGQAQSQPPRPEYTPKEFSQGVLALADRVRTAVREVNPDAVVIGETTSGELSQHWDGGLSADFGFGLPPLGVAPDGADDCTAKLAQGFKLTASPVRYGMPQVNYYGNGCSLNHLQQIYAAGHNLALCCASGHLEENNNFMYVNRAYIKQLVEDRQQYKDALIYGRQAYQPATGDENVIAYFYQGAPNQVITVVNTSETAPYSGVLALSGTEPGVVWQDVLSGDTFITGSGSRLSMQLAAGKLRLLVRQSGNLPAHTVFLPSVQH